MWSRPGGEILYVGATGLPLAARVWLHANDERPDVGRVRASRPEALEGDVEVRGFRVPPGVDRGAVRDCLEGLLGGASPMRNDFDEVVIGFATGIRSSLAAEVDPID